MEVPLPDRAAIEQMWRDAGNLPHAELRARRYAALEAAWAASRADNEDRRLAAQEEQLRQQRRREAASREAARVAAWRFAFPGEAPADRGRSRSRPADPRLARRYSSLEDAAAHPADAAARPAEDGAGRRGYPGGGRRRG